MWLIELQNKIMQYYTCKTTWHDQEYNILSNVKRESELTVHFCLTLMVCKHTMPTVLPAAHRYHPAGGFVHAWLLGIYHPSGMFFISTLLRAGTKKWHHFAARLQQVQLGADINWTYSKFPLLNLKALMNCSSPLSSKNEWEWWCNFK